jgi:2,3-dihydroxy-p-cumate/2,3-dihydroxybenzoate 3,4-dioxygenase
MGAPFRYRKLGYVALNATDIERTADFALNVVGLDGAGDGPDGARFLRCGADHHSLVLYRAGEPGFKRAGWELEDEENVERAYHHFESIGWRPKWVAREEAAGLGLGLSPVFRVREPTMGVCFEYYSKMLQTIVPFQRRLAKIERVGHFVLNAANCRESTKSMVENMGFLPSDYAGDLFISLLRAFPNPLHHSIGIGQSRVGRAHFNHVNFMVTDIDDIGKAYYRLQREKVEIVFGMGRHPTSDSIFIYFLDPDGMTWEYSFGMELFPEHNPRQPRFMSAAPQDFDVWGARPTPNFGVKGAIEAP